VAAHLHDYDLLGELGGADGADVWLARERQTGELVAVRLDPARPGSPPPQPAVLRNLGPGVPAVERACPLCRQPISDWRRFCGHCGTDVAGLGASGSGAGDLDLLRGEAERQNLDLLGRMTRAEGGDAVFFAQDRGTGQIVALTLEPGSGEAGGSPPVQTTAFTPRRVTLATGAQDTAPAGTGPGTPGAPPAATLPETVAGSAPAPGAAEPDADTRVCPACSRVFGPDVRFCSHDGSVLRAAAATDDLIGQILGDRYHILRAIGRGGMGQVYLAEHVKMGRRCAVKVMHRSMSQDTTAVSRFGREAANASRIAHPNVATIFDFGETNDRLIYLAMEYVEGASLSALLEGGRQLEVPRALRFAIEIAAALDAAHREGVVHRDLKPDNILIGRRGGDEFVKVVDFGIAKAMDAASSGLTQTGFVVGTPRYMSPEQLIAEDVDGRTDIYAVGLVLYEMLVGRSPATDEDGTLRLTARLTEPPPSARAANPAVPPELDDVIVKALARVPSDRFQTANDLRAALVACSAPVRAAATSPGTHARPTPAAPAPSAAPPKPPPAAAIPAAPASAAPARAAPAAAARQPAETPDGTARGGQPVPGVSAGERRPFPLAFSPRLVAIAAVLLLSAGFAAWLIPRGREAPTEVTGQPGVPAADASAPVPADEGSSTPAPAATSSQQTVPEPASAAASTSTAAPPTTTPTDTRAPAPAREQTTPAAPVRETPPAPIQPPPSFETVAHGEVRRFGAAIESRSMARVRAVFGAGGLSAEFDNELRSVLDATATPRVQVDIVGTSADALRVVFRMRITDGASGETVFSELLDAAFARAGSSWILIRIARR
jgi:eukaryotic-like serine/threonine-protein kinase